ncbi:MAG: hypothetical protein M1407_04110 [Deltaproteobacteria bacterium]|nr:hypothetical protein [Deltaproteobacteria bacterium]
MSGGLSENDIFIKFGKPTRYLSVAAGYRLSGGFAESVSSSSQAFLKPGVFHLFVYVVF